MTRSTAEPATAAAATHGYHPFIDPRQDVPKS